MTTLTKNTLEKIWEAWSYQAASPCSWAMSELDKYSIIPLHGGQLEIEGQTGNLSVDNIKEFLFWKNSDFRVRELSTLRYQATADLAVLINRIAASGNFNRAFLKRLDNNNQYFDLRLIDSDREFSLELTLADTDDRFKELTINAMNLALRIIEENIIALEGLSLYGEPISLVTKRIGIK
jgi:hypothetical protein